MSVITLIYQPFRILLNLKQFLLDFYLEVQSYDEWKSHHFSWRNLKQISNIGNKLHQWVVVFWQKRISMHYLWIFLWEIPEHLFQWFLLLYQANHWSISLWILKWIPQICKAKVLAKYICPSCLPIHRGFLWVTLSTKALSGN